MKELRGDPYAYAPRGLSREEAARYIGVGTTKFDEMVSKREMPKPKKLGGRVVWDRFALDLAFSNLDEEPANSIDAVLNG